jgi:ribonuclease HII
MKYLVGVDEAGRGPLAGPVVAAAVSVPFGSDGELWELGFRDSKALSPKERERLFCSFCANGFICWKAQAASPRVIDRMNILRASLWAMRKAVLALPFEPDLVIVDGTNTIPDLPYRQKAVAKADASFPVVAAASVVAKVLRDRVMVALDNLYPQYGFARHKGYPTAAHVKALGEFGPSPLHRKSFTWRCP